MESAGFALARWRQARQWSQGDLALALQVTQATVSRLEAGRADPSLALATDIERLTAGYVMATRWVAKQVATNVQARAAGVSDGAEL
jgi:DNA-binding XRE family transcriptional regulator